MTPFDYKGTTLHYAVEGQGPEVVFLHGFLENHTIWKKIAAEIQAFGFRTILIDLPCHGESRHVGETCTMQEMALIIDAFCSKEKIENPTVFGHSMGGYVGMELLKLRPIKLGLVHSNFWADSVQKKQDRNRVISIVIENKMRLINEAIPNLFASTNRPNQKKVISQLIYSASKIPSNEIVASTRGMRDRVDNTALLNQHSISIIQGDRDPVVPLQQMKRALKNVSRKQDIHLIENCGHMSIWESPEALINSLKLIVFK